MLHFGTRRNILLGLHTTILEPDFDLAFGQNELLGNFDASSAGQVAICLEFFFQFDGLMAGISLASAFRTVFGIVWKKERRKIF